MSANPTAAAACGLPQHGQGVVMLPGDAGSPARAHLVCFPFAGGAASSFFPWRQALGPDVDLACIQLPGREELAEAPLATAFEPAMRAIVPAAKATIGAAGGVPVLFFGHSLGALLAFETIRALRRRGETLPAALIVAGCRAPHRPNPDPSYHDAPDDVFIEKMRIYGGTPAEILSNDRLVRRFLPRLRADYDVFESYRYGVEPPLAVPFLVLGGTADRVVPESMLTGWERQTHARCTVEVLPGGHFFIVDSRTELLARVARFLDGTAAAATTAAARHAAAPSRSDAPSLGQL
jgi:medium-chain acyl-[acyl-carrier-protein] hydrolase